MPRKIGLCFFLSISLCLVGHVELAFCQLNLLYQKYGAGAVDELGSSVAIIGDVNGDGRADFVVGAPYDAGPNGSRYPKLGSAYVYSGVDGSLLYQKNSTDTFAFLGWSAKRAGDVNGDGKPDFITGAPGTDVGGLADAGAAYVYSGTNGGLLLRKYGAFANGVFGFSVAVVGDINGDGKADVIVGAPLVSPNGFTNAGSAYVFSGLNGALLYQVDGAASGDRVGYSVTAPGDLNGDGKGDFIVGVPYADPGGVTDAGVAYVYSGADGALLFQKNGPMAIAHFGLAGAGVGDINGDGKPDFMIGAPDNSPGKFSGAGSVYVYSGVDGGLLYQVDGVLDNRQFGHSVDRAGDMNADGKPDFVIGALGDSGDRGSMFIYSGATGARLCQVDAGLYDRFFGASVSGDGDMNGDGKPEVIVGVPGAAAALAGQALIFSADTVPPVISCPANIKVYATCPDESSKVVTFAATAIDGCPIPEVSCSPPSGSVFSLGITLVTCVASDVSGNKDTCAFSVTVVNAARGDMNSDGNFTTSDVVLMLNCAFLGVGICNLCFADLNCDGFLTPSDVVNELNLVFLGQQPVGCL